MGVETVGFNSGVPIRNGDKVPIEEDKNLYEFWKTKNKSLNKELEKGELFVNLSK
jgi:cytoplasmic iron level regulating protein YaaA (DUF328/UPF0246 family)